MSTLLLMAILFLEPGDTRFRIYGAWTDASNNKELIRVKADGTVILGQGVTRDDVVKALCRDNAKTNARDFYCA